MNFLSAVSSYLYSVQTQWWLIYPVSRNCSHLLLQTLMLWHLHPSFMLAQAKQSFCCSYLRKKMHFLHLHMRVTLPVWVTLTCLLIPNASFARLFVCKCICKTVDGIFYTICVIVLACVCHVCHVVLLRQPVELKVNKAKISEAPHNAATIIIIIIMTVAIITSALI